jgi:hypothetical protein
MVGKVLVAGALAGGGLLAASQWQDITRYLKIKQMSAGQDIPRMFRPAGRGAIPAPGQGAPDGVGAFDSARRGGPAGT